MLNRKLARYLFKITMMLICVMAAFVFTSSVQAAGCHDVSGHAASISEMPQNTAFHNNTNNSASNASGSVVSALEAPKHSENSIHACCKQECHCPFMSCGTGHGVAFASTLMMFNSGTEEQALYLSSRYFHLPHTVHFKPPIQA